jgi:hypothetical protein
LKREGIEKDIMLTSYTNRNSNVQAEVPTSTITPREPEMMVENKTTEYRDSIIPSKESQMIHSEKIVHKRSKPFIPNLQKRGDHCDIITFKDGTQLEVVVEEISTTEVKYKKCNFKDGPSFRTSKSNIKKIDMYNGQVYIPEDPKDSKNANAKGVTITVLVLGILAMICVIIGGILSGGYGFTATAALAPAGILSLIGLIMGAVNLGRDTSALSWIGFALNLLMQILAIIFTILMFI